MNGSSKIEWTEATWNPVTGCTKVSAGCKHCYAETMAHRLHAMGVKGYENGFTVSIHPDRLSIPLRRKKPTLWFVNSMSDLFHPKVPFDFVDEVVEIIRATPQHTYQILTKRPGKMRQYFGNRKVPTNAWLGTSVENKRHGVPRIDELRKINAKVRFLSVEPLLEDIGKIKLRGIHWVIVGGESGKGARPMQAAWVDGVRKQCTAAKVRFFFKQWGAWGPDGIRRSKKTNGREYKGKHWDQMPVSFHP